MFVLCTNINENKKEKQSIPKYMGANGEIIEQNGKRLW